MILCLAILVFFHEAGHFLAARMFGIRVEKFYLFFDAWGKKLFSFKKGDTEYGIGWLPLGGYVKIAGMIDESMDKEQMQKEPEPWEFRTKPAWQRLIVMVAGVTVNVLLAWAILSFSLIKYGESYIPNSKLEYGIVPLQLGKEIGLKHGDKLVSVNENKIERYSRLISTDLLAAREPELHIIRDGKEMSISVPSNLPDLYIDNDKQDLITYRFKYSISGVEENYPGYDAGLRDGDSLLQINGSDVMFYDQLQSVLMQSANRTIDVLALRGRDSVSFNVALDSTSRLGIQIFDPTTRKTLNYGFLESIPKGFVRSFDILFFQVKAISKMFTGDIDPQKSLGGPIAIAYELFGAGVNWERFWLSTALLSMILAFMNLLPIPALDGGHVVFLLWEMIRGKPASEKVMIGAQYVGMILLLSLMVLIILNDGWRYFIK